MEVQERAEHHQTSNPLLLSQSVPSFLRPRADIFLMPIRRKASHRPCDQTRHSRRPRLLRVLDEDCESWNQASALQPQPASLPRDIFRSFLFAEPEPLQQESP